jgi:hypothetical protein
MNAIAATIPRATIILVLRDSALGSMLAPHRNTSATIMYSASGNIRRLNAEKPSTESARSLSNSAHNRQSGTSSGFTRIFIDGGDSTPQPCRAAVSGPVWRPRWRGRSSFIDLSSASACPNDGPCDRDQKSAHDACGSPAASLPGQRTSGGPARPTWLGDRPP